MIEEVDDRGEHLSELLRLGQRGQQLAYALGIRATAVQGLPEDLTYEAPLALS